MESSIAREWMNTLALTANERRFEEHMDLISKKIRVFGVPGFEVIDYDDWCAQCKHEFERGILKRYSYDGVKVRVMTPLRIMFDTEETIEANDGTTQVMLTEILIEREPDGKWRAVQEKVHRIESHPPSGLPSE
ncbi:MAG: hypothetical protein ACREUA_05185 [Burkholderiales bacterium]